MGVPVSGMDAGRRLERRLTAHAVAVTSVGLLMALALAPVPVRAAASLDFEHTFEAPGEGGQSHFVANYQLHGERHHVEVWRDGEARVKRRTDDTIETYLVRPAGDIEWSMTVLDRKRRIRTDISRTNLFRIGRFADWFGEAHGLSRPKGDYRLVALAKGPAGPPETQPPGACRWYRLMQADRSTTLCWSAAARVPLVIVGADDTVVWRVTALDTRPIPAGVFDVDDRGYVRNDANADIAGD